MARKSLSSIIEDRDDDARSLYSMQEPEFVDLVRDSLRNPNLEDSEIYQDTKINNYKDIAHLDTDTLASLMDALYARNNDMIAMNTYFWNESVAPAKTILMDYDSAEYSLHWGKGPLQRHDLIVRTIPGHATSGHCVFKQINMTYPNTMTVDVVNALAKCPGKYRNQSFETFANRSQEEINDVVYWLESFFDSPKENRFAHARKPNNQELSDLQFLTDYKFNMIEALRGFYFAANMDNYDPIRKTAQDKYGVKMGGGETYAVDVNLLKKYNISLKEMSSAAYNKSFLNHMQPEKRIELFKKMGIIIDQEIDLENISSTKLNWDSVLEQGINPADYPKKDLRKVYIRNGNGNGVADDVAIALAGFLPQTFTNMPHRADDKEVLSRHIGAFFGDRIDTLEKDSSIIIPGGQDEVAGKYLNQRFKRFCQDKGNRETFNIRYRKDNNYNLINNSTLVDFTAASAITDTDIHSSQRYFLMEQKFNNIFGRHSTCALKEYIRLVQEKAGLGGDEVNHILTDKAEYSSYPDICIGFSHIPFEKVVMTILERKELVEKPNLRENNLREFFGGVNF